MCYIYGYIWLYIYVSMNINGYIYIYVLYKRVINSYIYIYGFYIIIMLGLNVSMKMDVKCVIFFFANSIMVENMVEHIIVII